MKFQTMIRTLSALVIGMLISSEPSAYGKDNNTLKTYLWKYRPLILFEQSPDNPAYRAILDSLSANQDEIAERHMALIEIFENRLVRIDGNLDKHLNPEITPSWLSFKLTQKVPESFYAGMILSYRLTPLPYTTINWITEIIHVREPDFFVDEQRFGPYKFWHHQHLFKASGNETEMTDIVHYAMGYGILGDLVHCFIVSPRLTNIFDYRYEKITRIFR